MNYNLLIWVIVCILLIWLVFVAIHKWWNSTSIEGFDIQGVAELQGKINDAKSKIADGLNKIQDKSNKGIPTVDDYSALYAQFELVHQGYVSLIMMYNTNNSSVQANLTSTQQNITTLKSQSTDPLFDTLFSAYDTLHTNFKAIVDAYTNDIDNAKLVASNKLKNIQEYKSKTTLQSWMAHAGSTVTTAEAAAFYNDVYDQYYIVDQNYEMITGIYQKDIDMMLSRIDVMKTNNILQSKNGISTNGLYNLILDGYRAQISNITGQIANLKSYDTELSSNNLLSDSTDNHGISQNSIHAKTVSLQEKINDIQKKIVNTNTSVAAAGTGYSSNTADVYHSESPAATPSDAMQFVPGEKIQGVDSDLYGVPSSSVPGGVYLSYIPSSSSGKYMESVSDVSSKYNSNGFCSAMPYDSVTLEEKCSSLGKDVCASTSCCVLLGGQKCVAGSQMGPSLTRNYGDAAFANVRRDFYYYNGKCYGNCGSNRVSVMGSDGVQDHYSWNIVQNMIMASVGGAAGSTGPGGNSGSAFLNNDNIVNVMDMPAWKQAFPTESIGQTASSGPAHVPAIPVGQTASSGPAPVSVVPASMPLGQTASSGPAPVSVAPVSVPIGQTASSGPAVTTTTPVQKATTSLSAITPSFPIATGQTAINKK